MRSRIQRSMHQVIFLSLAVCYALLTIMLYSRTLQNAETELKQEAGYIVTSLENTGVEYLKQIDDVHLETRVTLIDTKGNVLYDSGKDGEALENHKNRKEVQEALQKGSGQDIRKSDTVGEEMLYYAVRMEDGSVLRVSRRMNTVLNTALSMLPQMLLIGALMAAIAWLMSQREMEKLIRPINELDLEEPLKDKDKIYEELVPLLERLDRQNKEKEKVEQMRKEFSANVSHELKTPLTSISGYAEIMKEGLVKPEDTKKFADRIYQEAARMSTLVSDIMKLSKLDEGLFEIEKEPVDLYQLTREVISRLSLLAAQKQVRFELVGESVCVDGIRQVLEEMIYNLCENAIKYNVQGGTVSVWIGQTLQGVKVIVSDTGIGIPKEHQERIFERFYRVDKSHSRETGGTGLGLSIVKHGAILHNADITVTSEEGKGTRIELTF